MKEPKITIIMATYNRAQFIVESLQSIINQTYMYWECLIIDDGGTDNTKQVIKDILEKDSRFQFLKRPNIYKKGISGCRNYGIDNANGDYVIFFDDDDIVHPKNLELCLRVFQKEKVDFCVYEKQAFFDGKKPMLFKEEGINKYRLISKNDILAILTNKISIASCTVLWKKECFNNERFNENLMYAEEWECYPRIIGNNKKGVVISNILYFNRKHLLSNTGEFYANNKVRIDSKKFAIELLAKNLSCKNLLNLQLQNYLTGLAISFRDKSLLNNILIISQVKLKTNLYTNFKFYMFPIWRIYKRAIK